MNGPTNTTSRGPVGSAFVSELLYELLDAHADTTDLADDLASASLHWRAHLRYLSDLQRVGRETLAQLPTEATR